MKYTYLVKFLELAILILAAEFSHEDAREIDEIIVYPEILHTDDPSNIRQKRSVFTKYSKINNYDDNIKLKINLGKENVLIRLNKKSDHHTSSVLLRKVYKDGNAFHARHTVENCHYSGKIDGNKDSSAYISTCNGGFLGSIYDGNNSYDIMPNGNGSHKLIHANKILNNLEKELFKDDSSAQATENEISSQSNSRDQKKYELAQFQIANVEPQYIPYLSSNHTKFIELFISVDHIIAEHYNQDSEVIIEKVLNTIGLLDMSYQAINIRLVVVGIEIQTDGPAFKREMAGGADLGSFTNYINNVVRASEDVKDLIFDNAILLSHRGYNHYVVGMAYSGTMCTSISTSVNRWSFTDISAPVFIIGHELGHNLNFPHDVKGCKCLTKRGCFMREVKSSRPGFSDCNLKWFARKDFPCISNYPILTITKQCGNGIIEGDEECDCGTPEMCTKHDKCCEPYKCKLKQHAQCSYQNNPECCSEQCLYKKQGELCREPQTTCDVPEFCTGESAKCPADKVMRDGFHCGDRVKMLSGGRANTVHLTQPVYGRFFKFIPKLVSKSKRTCMSLELYGCEKDEEKPNSPTPISTPPYYYHREMCLAPEGISSCEQSVPDGTNLIYKQTKDLDCNHDYMLFIHAGNGTLIHQCSNKFVCPDKNLNLLILSDKCDPEISTFERTEESSVRHVKTGKCLLSPHYFPKSNHHVGLRELCVDKKYSRSKLIFQTVDCLLPMTKKLQDSAFSASSYEDGFPPKRVRIGDKAWCTKINKKHETWLTIDLGQTLKIKELKINGHYFDYVTGFYLYYSDNGKKWTPFRKSQPDLWKGMDSYCYKGECVPTHDHQCKMLWDADAKMADKICWEKLNMGTDAFGTCDRIRNVSCSQTDMYCGQLQCTSSTEKPYYTDYGKSYRKFTFEKKECSGAAITQSDDVGFGFVYDGTKCGKDKMCLNQKCRSLKKHGVKFCKIVNGKECNGQGVCRDDGICHCEKGMNPSDGCKTELVPVNGGWSQWSSWSTCPKACNGGMHFRYRYCNQPVTRHGGKQCEGAWKEKHKCNTEPCPVAKSCRALKYIFELKNKPLHDGVYTIEPVKGQRVKTYCDFTRNGGGWTLLVTSCTNTWTEENVQLRNIMRPSLHEDYSMLKYADMIKFSYLSGSPYFEYRLEADMLGHWGGIFTAPSSYVINSHNPRQTNIKLKEKFGNWTYKRNGIEERLPYLYKHRLTTSLEAKTNFWGTITDNRLEVTPANWIQGALMMPMPKWIWYWIRESEYSYPKSCLEVMYRGYHEVTKFKSGVYRIEPKPGKLVTTYCDFDRHGGGWTLLSLSSRTSVWKDREEPMLFHEDPKSGKYSIFTYIDTLKQADPAEISFEYMIEADGEDQHGGIFSLPVDFSLLVCPPKGRKPKILKKFGDWDENVENIANYPMFMTSKVNGIYLTASTDDSNDLYGTLISTKGTGKFMTSYPNAEVIKVWIRPGGSRRSCNEIRTYGLHKGKNDYKDGFYLLRNSQTVYCDMTTTQKEGWTLLVTSTSTGWNAEQVLSRDPDRPSLSSDYSILNQADSIKSLCKKERFKYMLDAHSRRRWGGIWSASVKHTFTSKWAGQTDVELLKQFDRWDYNVRWWTNPQQRMPYLGDPRKHRALLTTAHYSFWYEWGSIIAEDGQGKTPAKWITPQMESPMVIWYWVNENDCDEDYKPIHGAYEEWSVWTPCTSFCDVGRQTRKRRCNAPVPRCGGNPCPTDQITFEERNCTGACRSSTIRTADDKFCILPQSEGCDVEDNTRLILKVAATHCEKPEAHFIFNPSTGELIHKCSKKLVCPQNGNTYVGNQLVISDKCPKATLEKHFSRTLWDSIQYSSRCLKASSGKLKEDAHIVLDYYCRKEYQRLVFSDLAKGPVHVSIYDDIKVKNIASVKDNSHYPNIPSSEGFMDNLDSPLGVSNYYGLKMWTYFKAPMNGNYVFTAACDDVCQVYISEHKDSIRHLIIDVKSWTRHYEWNRHRSQRSRDIQLEMGKRYYMEVIFGEIQGDDHVSVGVYLPDGTPVLPISSHYLSINEN